MDSIASDVIAVLEEVGCSVSMLPRKVRDVLDAIARRPHVPALVEVERQWSSRRSFYRSWSECIQESPSAFLRRIRTHHAQRLMEAGLTKKEVAHRAGFGSVDAMRRILRNA